MEGGIRPSITGDGAVDDSGPLVDTPREIRNILESLGLEVARDRVRPAPVMAVDDEAPVPWKLPQMVRDGIHGDMDGGLDDGDRSLIVLAHVEQCNAGGVALQESRQLRRGDRIDHVGRDASDRIEPSLGGASNDLVAKRVRPSTSNPSRRGRSPLDSRRGHH